MWEYQVVFETSLVQVDFHHYFDMGWGESWNFEWLVLIEKQIKSSKQSQANQASNVQSTKQSKATQAIKAKQTKAKQANQAQF